MNWKSLQMQLIVKYLGVLVPEPTRLLSAALGVNWVSVYMYRCGLFYSKENRDTYRSIRLGVQKDNDSLVLDERVQRHDLVALVPETQIGHNFSDSPMLAVSHRLGFLRGWR